MQVILVLLLGRSQAISCVAWQVGPVLVGDGNLISEASSFILADAGAENLYKGRPVAQLSSFINRRFRADYLSTGMTMASCCHL